MRQPTPTCCKCCGAPVLQVVHEFTRRTLLLDVHPRAGGEFALVEDRRGRPLVRCAVRRRAPAACPAPPLFAAHRCAQAAWSVRAAVGPARRLESAAH